MKSKVIKSETEKQVVPHTWPGLYRFKDGTKPIYLVLSEEKGVLLTKSDKVKPGHYNECLYSLRLYPEKWERLPDNEAVMLSNGDE